MYNYIYYLYIWLYIYMNVYIYIYTYDYIYIYECIYIYDYIWPYVYIYITALYANQCIYIYIIKNRSYMYQMYLSILFLWSTPIDESSQSCSTFNQTCQVGIAHVNHPAKHGRFQILKTWLAIFVAAQDHLGVCLKMGHNPRIAI